MLTAEQTRCVHQAISDCDRFIERETARGPHNRPADTQQALDAYIAHKARMIKMLDDSAAAWAPTTD
jgi:hypothetical protein